MLEYTEGALWVNWGALKRDCSYLKTLSPALGAPVATQLTRSPWCLGCLLLRGPKPPNIPCWVPLQLCRSGEVTGCPGSPGPIRSWPIWVPLNLQVLVQHTGLLEHLGQRTEFIGVRESGIGACTGDYQGRSYQAVAGQLGLQLPEPSEDGVSVGSKGTQDLLQRCPSPGLTALCQSLTKC